MPSNYSSNSCGKCPYNGALHLQIGIGVLPLSKEVHNSSILLVFQAPGNDEWYGKGKGGNPAPIISTNIHSAAYRMCKAFERTGKSRTDFDITEAVQCYPGKNKNGRDKAPRKKAIQQCQNHLKNDIINGHYRKIISFGKISNNSVDAILLQNKINICHVKMSHPCGGLTNAALDNSIK